MQKARAIYDYDARASDELSFKRHDVLEVLGVDEEDEGWYRGRSGVKEGLFPYNYVVFLQESSEAPDTQHLSPIVTQSIIQTQLPAFVKCMLVTASYTFAETLGRGRFSHVRRCKSVSAGHSYAVKIMDLEDPELGANPSDAEKEVLAEVRVLRMVMHEGIVELVDTIKDGGKYYLILEDLSGGDLFDRIEQNGPFKEKHAALLLRQIVGAVHFLHDKGIVHRDLKPDNLVFQNNGPSSVCAAHCF